jgi:hypothetical protein
MLIYPFLHPVHQFCAFVLGVRADTWERYLYPCMVQIMTLLLSGHLIRSEIVSVDKSGLSWLEHLGEEAATLMVSLLLPLM